MNDRHALTWVVVAHDDADDLAVLLPSLHTALEAVEAQGVRCELVVADNASQDGTAAMVRRCAPSARLERHSRNLGYGAALNRAAERARTEWLVFSNSDLMVPAGGLDALPAVLDRTAPDVAIVGPAVYTPHGPLDPTYGRFPNLWRLLRGLVWRGTWTKRAAADAADRRVDWVTGACLIVRRDVFLAVGGFDEDYFLYYEDVDLALRLRRGGHRTFLAPSLSVVHVHPHHVRGRRNAAIEAIVRRSRQLYFRKHRPAWEGLVLRGLEAVERLWRWQPRSPEPGRGDLPVPLGGRR